MNFSPSPVMEIEAQIHRLIQVCLWGSTGLGTFLIPSKASDARRQGATTEAYGPIRRKEQRMPARLGRDGNAADGVLMVGQGEAGPFALASIPAACYRVEWQDGRAVAYRAKAGWASAQFRSRYPAACSGELHFQKAEEE